VGSEKNKPPSTDKVTKKSLGEMLVEEKLVTPAQLESALALQRQQGGKLSDIGLQQGVIKAEQLATVLSIKLNLPLIDLKRHTIQPRALRLIPDDMARRHMLIPLDIVNDSLMVVMADPEDIRTIEDIKTQAGMRIEVALGVLSDIEPYLMDLQPLALARAASRREAIIVNMEPDCFDIVFVAGGIPSVIHTISPRSEGATLEDNIKRLSDELTKTAAFSQNRYPQSPLSTTTPLLLTGDLSLELPARGLLQAETEYPVEPLVPPLDCPPELPVAAYTGNIGLALKKTARRVKPAGEDSGYYDININILSGKHRKIRARPGHPGLWISGAFIAVAVISIFILYQARSQAIRENNQQQIELSNISHELNLANLIAEENARTESSIRELTTSNEALQAADRDILGIRGDFTRYLRVVTGALPPATDFTVMEIDGQQARVHGDTDSVFAVIDYAIALEATGIFTEVRITELDEAAPASNGAGANGAEPVTYGKITFAIVMNK
jgi:hypothetical protein